VNPADASRVHSSLSASLPRRWYEKITFVSGFCLQSDVMVSTKGLTSSDTLSMKWLKIIIKVRGRRGLSYEKKVTKKKREKKGDFIITTQRLPPTPRQTQVVKVG
jgi:hypothetical protein